jgi:hypothetical protein
MLFVGVLGVFTPKPYITKIHTSKPPLQELDLSNALIRLADLPAGFQDLPDSQKASMETMLDMFRGKMHGADIKNFSGYWTANTEDPQFVISGLVSPLIASDQVLVDQAFANPAATYEQLKSAVGGKEVTELSGAGNIGSTQIAFSTMIGFGSTNMHLEYIVAHRGPVLVEVAYIYLVGKQPLVNSIEIARILDDRVAEVVGRETGVAFRPAGPAVPELTTHIPTPLDVSRKPTVVGANLLLAALMMLPFAVAAESLTRTLGEHEDALKALFRPTEWLQALQQRLNAASVSRWGRHPALLGMLKLLGVMLFYGLVFSLLDRTWNPFSLKGVVLFLSMTIAYGVIGIADDLFQWRAVRKWGLPAELKVRPTNFMLAVASTATTRLLTLVPGLMFGTPEALCMDEAALDEDKRRQLLRISARTFIIVGLAVWLPTIVTSRLQLLGPPETIATMIGGLEAFLLVLFAVAMENTFVQMLGFPGGFGQALKKKNRWLWLVGLVAVTFAFLHTLLNPRGELIQALQQGNVILFLSVTAGFVVVTFALHFYFRQRERATARLQVERAATEPLRHGDIALPGKVTGQPSELPVTSAPSLALSEIQTKPIIVSIDGSKECPVCCKQIKAEAKICRFCRAVFAVSVCGYCLADHAVVEVVEGGRCQRCGGQVADVHVESWLIKAPAVLPAQAVEGAKANVQIKPSSGEAHDTRRCPVCGQTIKAEARLCRFCRTQLDN